jgi:predicted permease
MLNDLKLRFRALFRRTAVEDELDAELRFHFDQHVKKLVASGLPLAEARRRARLEFGTLDQVKEECRDARGVHFIQSLAQDVRYAVRILRKSPSFTVVAILTLALGIGATTAVFSVLDGVLLKPLPFPHPDELVYLTHTEPSENLLDLAMAPFTYFIYRDQNHTFQDIGLYQGDSVTVTGSAQPERVVGLDVTDGLLSVLGVPTLLGRTFTRADDSPGSPKTVVLSYGFWRREFGGDPSAVGRNLIVDGVPRQIIGVMPQRFRFLMDSDEPPLFLPLQLDRDKTEVGNFSYGAIARLKPGATIAQANADVAHMLPIAFNSFPPMPGFSVKILADAGIVPHVEPLKTRLLGDIAGLLSVLMAGVGLVLLIACANVANLLLVRTEGRQHELAVRAALGASRSRLAGELLLESAVLALLGGALGIVLAYFALPALLALAPETLPRADQIGIDGPALLFAGAAALLASLVSASFPIFKYVGAHLGTGLREAGRAASESRERHRARSALVITQVALAFVLLICSGLMIRTFRALTHVEPGFSDPSSVQTFSISIPKADVSDADQLVRVENNIQQAVESIPGVSSAAFGTAIPMGGNGWADPIFVEGRSYAETELPPLRRFKFVSPGYLATLGTPLLAGRDFTWADTYNKLPATIVSERVAQDVAGNPAAAIGKRIRPDSVDDWREIIGVVAEVYQDGVDKDAPSTVYWPLIMPNFEGMGVTFHRDVRFVVRTSRAGTPSLRDDLLRAVSSVDPNLPLAQVNTLDFYYKRSMARTSFTLIMLAIAGGMSLLLGVLGLYGVIAYSVSQRTREIGIRMALGAQQQDLTRMFVRHGLVLAVAGVAFGFAASAVAMGLMKSLLFHVGPSDPLTYVAVSVGLIATAALASYLPSRRAAKVDPLDALRAE